MQLAGPEPQLRRVQRRLPGLGDVLEEPADPERDRLLGERGAQPHEPAPPAAPPHPLRGGHRHPQLDGRRRGALGQHVLERTLQLLGSLVEQVPQRPAEQGGAAGAEGPGGLRVDDGRAQVHVDQDHAPGGVVHQRLAQRDGPLQVDLGVHLAEGAVHPGGLAVRSGHPGRLGTDQDPAAVLGEEGELVHLAAGDLLGRHEPVLDVLGVGGPCGPAGESLAAHRLGGGPAQDPLGLAVPVGDHAVGVERAQGGVHPVEQRCEQVVGGLTTSGSTHLAPPAGVRAIRVCGTSDH